MRRRDGDLIAAAIVFAVTSGVSWTLWILTGAGWAMLFTAAHQLGGAALIASLIPAPRRALAVALGVAVPVLGPLAAALSNLVAGAGGTDLLHDPHAQRRTIDGTDLARLLTGSLPACEALASASVETRRLALAKLTTRAAAEDIATLRWARVRQRGEASIEIALALEEIGARFERRAAAARAAATAAPSYESLAAVFRVLTDAIASGLVEGPMVARLTTEACRYHEAALWHDPTRGDELLAGRARVELAMRRPQRALELLTGPGIDVRSSRELAELLREAAYAARRFDLAPEHAVGYA